MKIVVLLGGDSPEREVSLVTGREIAKQLSSDGHLVYEIDPINYHLHHDLITDILKTKPDLVFIGLHGGSGENGQLQAVLEMNSIRFTGSRYVACAIAMDKYLSKLIALDIGIPAPEYLLIKSLNVKSLNLASITEQVKDKIGFPLIVKPRDGGSSVGISVVDKEDGFFDALSLASNYCSNLLVEKFIDGRELTVTVLDGDACPVVEIVPKSGWYDYHNKYTKGSTIYEAPAKLLPTQSAIIQKYASQLWNAMECRSYARIDFRFDGEQFYFLEVNTLPGMTPLSLTPMAAKAAGLSFGELLEKIIQSTL